jgi:hypothetical protein
VEPFFGSGVVVSQNSIPIGLQGTLYDPLEYLMTIVKPPKIQISSLETFGLMSAFLAFMAMGPGSNSFDRLNSYVKTVHISPKNY